MNRRSAAGVSSAVRASLGAGLLLGLLLSPGPARSAAALELVRDGRAAAVVVVDRPAGPAADGKGRRGKADAGQGGDEEAARVLVDWIRKITGAGLPVVSEPPPDGGAAIYVGAAAVRAGLSFDDPTGPGREGVRIVVDGRRALVAGPSGAVTLKAACRFLEELGCRYYMDGELGEEYPRTPTLSLGPRAIAERPGLLGRNPKGPSWRADLWKTWNGAGGEAFQHQHAWGGYLPRDLYDHHPEFFAMDAEGRRKRGDWLCTSNPELRAYFADRVIEAIGRGTKHPSLSPPDGRGYCRCPACAAQDNPAVLEPSSGSVSVTDRYVDFLDAVARRVAAVHPDSVLSFYAYADYTQPPSRPRRLSPNLCVVIAPIRYCRLHEIGHEGCPSRMQQVAMIDGWAASASRLGYYNYLYNLADGTLPFFKFTACRKEFPYLADRGLSHMTIEVLSNWHIYGPQIYLAVRMAYDPRADAAAIMEDYWHGFYGPRAGPIMKQYWMGLDAALAAAPSHAGGFAGLSQAFTPDLLARSGDLLSRAAEAARGVGRHEQRVALHAAGFESAVRYRALCDAMNRGDFAAAKATYDAELARLEELAAKGWANREYATAYLRRFVGPSVAAGAALTAPPNRLVAVLPDRWRFRAEEAGAETNRSWAAADLDDRGWAEAATFSKTLDAQGLYRTGVLWYRTGFAAPERHGPLTLFFSEVDGLCEVHVNGRMLEGGNAKARQPFEVDVTAAVRPGTNVVALRVDHTKITDLALGGILRPVLLVERPR